MAPALYHVSWGFHIFPSGLQPLTQVRSLQITPGPESGERIFSVFPHLHTLSLDCFLGTHGVQKLPQDHPLQRLELGAPIQRIDLEWESVHAHCFTRVSVITMHHYSITVLFGACCDPEWQLRSLTVDYEDVVDAVFVSGERECRMTTMWPTTTPTLSQSWSMGKILSETAWLRGLATLTLSLAISSNQNRPSLLLPRGRLPVLTTFEILCGTPVPSNFLHVLAPVAGTLFSGSILAECDVLDAPKLHTICLLPLPRSQQRTPDTLSIISPSALARFISDHVKFDGERIPVRSLDDPGVRLEEDDGGMKMLRALVGQIECTS